MLENINPNRRDFLKLLSTSAIGAGISLNMPSLFSKSKIIIPKRVEHVIYLFMSGGMSHIDTFDPKPGTKVQGQFKTIDSANGNKISEKLPKLAKLMDRVALINSMNSNEGSHPRGQYLLHTNFPPLGTLVHPTMGSWISKYADSKSDVLPNFITIGKSKYGSGYFGSKYEPLNISNPQKGLANIKINPNLSKKQFEDRLGLLEELNKSFSKKIKTKNKMAYDDYYQESLKIMFSDDAKAFDINDESNEIKALYGNNKFGEGCLLARRLVEKNVKFIEVSLGNWDTHNDNFERVDVLSQTLDQGLSALLIDLEKRKLLDKTLITLGTEFGRSPKINDRNGRGHYPKAFSCLLAGGGIKGGIVLGKTDEEGRKIIENPVTHQDVNATMAYLAGINPQKEVYSNVGRPFKLANKGKPIFDIIKK
ncbi:MAG: hypothetical protein COA79_24035 [Planctomycetota bacterium]|nr:MAG: hypothetical protein COA79_24035 [Planctomycetota bacterium]